MSQIIIDAIVENSYWITREDNISHYMDLMCSVMDVKVIHRYFHRFEPVGTTACYVLKESHFCVHTWPEKRQISIDIYSCKEYDEETINNFIICSKILLKIEKIINLQKIKRTIDNDSNPQSREL